jgi:leucyl-tRNA synthetase
MAKYDHKEIEPKWQARWREANLYEVDLHNAENPYYLLFEFPYPSGDLHTGHWYAYAMPDIFARYLRMKGHDVLFPIGFDAFGLPAENAAIKRKLDPKQWTESNMEAMEAQLKKMGASFDWSKKVVTSNPEYYAWTQWIFTKLFEHGLAIKKEAVVNWCPSCQTVLAHEQVIQGTCERCGSEVEQRTMSQWFFKITEYADKLLAALDELKWPEEIKEAQRAWIGKSDGSEIPFLMKEDHTGHEEELRVFTTRADTLMGVTFLVVSPEKAKEWMGEWWHANDEVRTYVDRALLKRERERLEGAKEKTGVQTELVAMHPITKEAIPIFVADYVLGSYGTGAVMGVPGHDERDREFAEKFSIPTVSVLDEQERLIHSGEYDGLESEAAKGILTKAAGGTIASTYRLRDWSIGRQRYWGCPIPIVYDREGNPHTVPQEHLPWLLPTDVDFTPDGTPPLARSKELLERTTKIFGEGWTPDTETMDTFVDSSWYFYRYLSPQNTDVFAPDDLLKKWTPVDRYSGGSEHTTMHLLYARFIARAFHELALVPTPEPFLERMNRGIILGSDGHKMSKSKGNVLNPDDYVEKYGADTVRSYLSFIGPYNEAGHYPWSLEAIHGMRKFLDRVWALHEGLVEEDAHAKVVSETVRKVTRDLPQYKFHTALASLMMCLNEFETSRSVSRDSFETFLKLLAPYAPHLTDELWEKLQHSSSIHEEAWPEALQEEDEDGDVAVQVDGKVRGHVMLSKKASQEEAEKAARGVPRAAEALLGPNERIVYLPGRVLNIVTKEQT